MNDTAATLKELEQKRRAAWRGYALFGLMNLLLLLLLLTRRTGTALLVLALELAYYFLLARPDIKGYAAAFRVGNAAAAMAKHMEKAAYQGRDGIGREVVLAGRLLPIRPKSCLTYHRITGERERMELELSDVSFQLENGEEGRRAPFLTGCWVRVKLDCSPGKRLRMSARTLAAPDALQDWFLEQQGLRAVAWEREALDGLFYSCAGPEDGPSLPEAVVARIDELARTAPTPFALGIEGDTLTFFFHRRYITCGDPGLKRPLTLEDLERDPLPELEQVIGLARAYRRMGPSGQTG